MTFDYWPGGFPRGGDPRRGIVDPASDAERAALHPVLWPSEMSARFTLRQWLMEERFDCVEQAFGDLEGTKARFPSGEAKLVSFLGAMPELVLMRDGMTEREIDELMAQWKAARPDSILVEILWPRLLNAAAWHARGHGTADTVTSEGRELFRRLNAQALARVKAASPQAKKHLLWHFVALRMLSDNRAATGDIDQLTFAALKRFPQESGLALMAANGHMPQWGGDPQSFEHYASRVRETVGPERGDTVYALVYTRLMDTSALLRHPAVRLPLVRSGLLEAAQSRSFEDIARLQNFACATRDEKALRMAQSLWTDYAREPQLVPPDTQVDARCRAWMEGLPPR